MGLSPATHVVPEYRGWPAGAPEFHFSYHVRAIQWVAPTDSALEQVNK